MTPVDNKQVEELFGPIKKTVNIELMGKTYPVPEDIEVLRAIQYIEMVHDGPSINYSKLCWNNRCHNCLVEYENRKGDRKIFEACQMKVRDGLKIVDVPLAFDL